MDCISSLDMKELDKRMQLIEKRQVLDLQKVENIVKLYVQTGKGKEYIENKIVKDMRRLKHEFREIQGPVLDELNKLQNENEKQKNELN